ncbi:hypothetical protein PSUM_09700 [Pseudomonas umsongensis]|jgi:hypothetical protein|uniref:Type VI secretion system protein ImpL n=1 Tax=Pseudomonas umsongensis TaxID=198618 RepID=A0ABX4E351_9PSED|nr:hypothetical protein [Pseudomonas umsongensis]OXR36107.1 hypothetical protein PSUM_09700 [Pseudomonas umsongensis]SDT52823.1 hypothetical protein SAMN04490206_3525 [Pseudomonas umsongensis]
MPIRLDKVPPPALYPQPPRFLLWLGLLLLFCLLGTGGTLLFGDETLPEQPSDLWHLALGFPILGWCVLGFGRMLLYVGEHGAAEGWDEAREEDLTRKIRQGRRSQQVLGVSLQTALQEPGDEPSIQLEALLSGANALKSQASRMDGAILRHSCLSCDADENPEALLLSIWAQTLADLAPTLAQLPADQPLALLLDVDTGLPENQWRRVWQQAWRESGIRQPVTPVDGGGLTALDQWLDRRIRDRALLLVVAVQFAPQQPEGTAEAAVGLLFGNRLTQTTLAPIAYLHRPEQERTPSSDDLLYATRQALDWVPLESTSIERVWRVGIDAQRAVAVASVLSEVLMPVNKTGLSNLDAMLGHPGCISPWLAVATGTQAIARGIGPQFIFSGGGGATGLWGTVLMPVSAL